MKKLISLTMATIMAIMCLFIPAYAESNVLGDANGDGKVTAVDARVVLRAATKLEENTCELTIVDIDENGIITAVDARLILRVATKLDKFECIRNGNKESVIEEASTPSENVDSSSAEGESTEPNEPTTNIEETEVAEIPATMELAKIGNLQYYLYSPKNPTDDMPLIIYLHGGTNKKTDVEELLTTDGFPKYLYEGYYGDLRAYVAVPKLSNDYKGWADIYEQIRNLIKELNRDYGISMDKVSLTGHSMGGTGTYQLQVKLPNTFACIVPMSGSIRNTEENLIALAKTKIWAFVGTDDTIVEPEASRTIISELQEMGATATITELSDATHFDVPALVYKNNDLIDWLVNCGN